ncbi:DoxX family protein [Pedobacter chinensis]|uniref:DoxX family protein n=1 Tax=Pedobacter chinensis TaxID=2282421 RepID=A0A369PVY2_9SPHI|nr:DoxX family protein [Pedobacter chinensis]RDC55157.1 DoxX family protein [Pedobacter chinensis]
MKKILIKSMYSDLWTTVNNQAILIFRIAVSLELIVVHGLKKIGIGTVAAEVVPNPLDIPETLNQLFAVSANLVFPLFIIAGLFTRIATIPILAVTLTGYFVVHGNDSLIVRDVPFMFSVAFLFIAAVGPGRFSLDYFFSKSKYSRP